MTHDLVVFRTPDSRGWGLKTGPKQSIAKGEIIMGYSGQFFSENDRIQLSHKYNLGGNESYLMDLKPQKTNSSRSNAMCANNEVRRIGKEGR